jgi:hypothetical protein
MFDHLFGTPEQQAASARAFDLERAAAAAQATAALAQAKKDGAALEAREFRPLRPYCNRCGGRGFLPSFAHIKGGACFACN